MAKPTPGPWTHEDDTGEGRCFRVDGPTQTDGFTGGYSWFSDADARLIAAAPDLYAACKAALDWYGLDGDHITEPVRSQLLAAIAKADGSAPADPGATGGV